MKDSDHRELWREALEESIDPGFEAASLARTLASVRRFRRGRRIAKTAGASVMLGFLFYLTAHLSTPPKSLTAGGQASPQPAKQPEPAVTKVHFLTDEELLDRFPNRAVALIGPPEHERLVFLEDGR